MDKLRAQFERDIKPAMAAAMAASQLGDVMGELTQALIRGRTYEDLAKNEPEALKRLWELNPQEFNRLAREHERRRDLPNGWPPA